MLACTFCISPCHLKHFCPRGAILERCGAFAVQPLMRFQFFLASTALRPRAVQPLQHLWLTAIAAMRLQQRLFLQAYLFIYYFLAYSAYIVHPLCQKNNRTVFLPRACGRRICKTRFNICFAHKMRFCLLHWFWVPARRVLIFAMRRRNANFGKAAAASYLKIYAAATAPLCRARGIFC